MANNSIQYTERERLNSLRNSNKPSLDNPSWDYLFNNYTKAQLQKHCRQIGINKIWLTKDKLVDAIMLKHRVLENCDNPSDQNEVTVNPLEKVLAELAEIKENMSQKEAEIDELNIMIKSAHVTINRLNDRITTLEEKLIHSDHTALPTVSVENEKILLLGDDNLYEVRISDLGEDCSVKSINDATIDLMKCWVNEKLEWIPSKCIMYCGTHDLIENDNIVSIFDDLGFLVAELKNVNENIELFVCELAPNLENDLDNKIKRFNDKLREWSTVNGIQVVNMNLHFKLGTGAIDDMCFSHENEGAMLNRYGVIRLLDAIKKQYPHLNMCISREELMKGYREGRIVDRKRENKQVQPIVRNDEIDFSKSDSVSQRGTQLSSNTHSSRPLGHPSNNQQRRNVSFNNERFRNNYYTNVAPPNHHRHSSGANAYTNRPANNSRWRDPQYNSSPHNTQHNSSMNMDRYNTRRGCYNCGEYNHRQNVCRFDHRLKCGNCGTLGHKSKMCLVFPN